WGRWKSPDATGLKTLWIKKQNNPKQKNINDQSTTIEGQAEPMVRKDFWDIAERLGDGGLRVGSEHQWNPHNQGIC
ncbi:MAG: hypothetical protein ACO2O0_03090, partial [Desulfurococcales archaeon]